MTVMKIPGTKYAVTLCFVYLLFFALTGCEPVSEEKKKEAAGKAEGQELKTYLNPVIPGFYPDPSICKAGDDFYLVNSTFQYFPGVPVFHSKDLIHWRQIGNVLTRESQLDLKGIYSSGGIFAPTIRYHKGTFYMITTNIGKGGNFYVTAKKPEGPWSDPIWIEQQGIDPDLFFDDDGKVYVTGSTDGTIRQSEIDIKTGKELSEPAEIWGGTGGRFPEGPHIYKKDGWYYLLISEGGTEYGHYVTIARSRNVSGPYESYKGNPILTHRNRGMHTLQGTGHADLIRAQDGSWWMVFLGFRKVGWSFHHLGRETFLAPVTWNNEGWPVVNETGTIEYEMKAATLPFRAWKQAYGTTGFDDILGPEWIFLRNPDVSHYSLSEKPGYLRLMGDSASLDDAASPAFTGVRQRQFKAEISAILDFDPEKDNEEAGLTVYMDEKHHYDIAVQKLNGKRHALARGRIGPLKTTLGKIPLEKGPVELLIKADENVYTFYIKNRNGEEVKLGTADCKYLSSEVAGGFTGVVTGIYATGNGEKSTTPAYFDRFDYKELSNKTESESHF